MNDRAYNAKFWVHQAELQRATVVKSLAGAVKKEWNLIGTRFGTKFGTKFPCYIRALSGNELVAAQKAGFKSDYRMYCGKDLRTELSSVELGSMETSSIQCGDKVVSDGKAYEITFVNEQLGAHLQIDLKRMQ
jgi:hypothetical protein